MSATQHDGLYRDGMRLLAEGHVLEACDALQQALAAQPADPQLRYGLYLARSRATPGAALALEIDHELERHASDSPWYWKLLSIKARLFKAEGEHRAERFADAAELYFRAWELSGDVYPGVNAASLLYLAGQETRARDLAATLVRLIESRGTAGQRDYWEAATLGELCVLGNRDAAAIAAYAQADRQSAGNHGDRASMRRQLRLLAARNPALVARVLETCFAQPRIVVFTGHRVDADGRTPPRFPPAALPDVAQQLARFVRAHAENVGFCSAAAGGDILFAEAMLDAGARVHVVLPVPPQQFAQVSVAPAGADWLARYERVLECAARVIVAHHQVREVPPVLYTYTNLLCDGLARLHADSIDARVEHCTVLNPHSLEVVPGGTRHEFERWSRRGYAVHQIVPQVAAPAADVPAMPAADSAGFAQAARPDGALGIRAMVFADLVGSSRLDPEQLPELLVLFLSEARRILERTSLEPVMRNTWGDGLLLVFESVAEAARFAARLVREVAWPEREDGYRPSIRVSVHAGPVVEAHDPILERANVFGHHVIRAARVEPVTPPGAVFATEEAASILRATSDQRIECVYMGRIAMPKGFGQTPIYRIDMLD